MGQCALAWRHVAVLPEGRILPCCRFMNRDLLASYTSIGKALTSPEMDKLRGEMGQGKWAAGCEKCHSDEEANRSSLRIRGNSRFPEPLEKPFLASLEISFSNACNMACRMCNAQLSTSWYEEAKALMGYSGPRRHYLDWDFSDWDLSRLRWLKILGGEPLYERKNLELVQYMAKNDWLKNLSLHFTTNTSVNLSPEWTEIIKQCRNARIFCSIDGVEEGNEYLRHGSQWSQTEKVFKSFVDILSPYDHVELGVHTVVSLFNVLSLGRLESWIGKVGGDPTKWSLDFLFEPKAMSLGTLPESLKDQFRQRLPDFRFRKDVQQFLDVHQNQEDPEFRERFSSFHQPLDQRRQQDWRRVFPELDFLGV